MRGDFLKRWFPALFGSAFVFGATAAMAISPEEQGSLRKDCIRPNVWGGFETRDGVYEAAETFLGESELTGADKAWIKTEIERQWAEKKKAEATWPEKTDDDRLDAVFQALDKSGILALHNAGNTQSDARSDAGEAWHARGGPKSGLRGFVFYHGQDLERVIDDGQLYVGYGVVEGTKEQAVEIAREASAALSKAGFAVTVPATADERIVITGIDWKKRSPN